ncbi:MAG: MOSC N-terminal beta barrel domain-containing protein [Acidimicrobiales bacterium]
MGASLVDSRVVGRVAGLWRYPVKSLAPESLQEVGVSWHGVSGDRRWAFLDEGRMGSGFPWLTMRERPDLARYRPSFRVPDRPDRSPVVVSTPNGDVLEITDPALAAELGGGVRAVKQDRGAFDALPLSLITTQTVAGLGELIGGELAVERFRPNVLVEAHGDAERDRRCDTGKLGGRHVFAWRRRATPVVA